VLQLLALYTLRHTVQSPIRKGGVAYQTVVVAAAGSTIHASPSP
jgi:hypothetical protein